MSSHLPILAFLSFGDHWHTILTHFETLPQQAISPSIDEANALAEKPLDVGLTSDKQDASSKIEWQLAKHKVAIRCIKRIRLDCVVKTLRQKADCCVIIQHARPHLVEDFWLHLYVYCHSETPLVPVCTASTRQCVHELPCLKKGRGATYLREPCEHK
jgi:hypothetical protein